MAQDVEEMIARMNKCKSEVTYALRKHEEDAQAAVKALSSLKDELVEQLSDVAPHLRLIKGYTAKQISENRNGEIKIVQETVQALKKYADAQLKYLEDQL